MQLTVSLDALIGYFHCKDNQFQSCLEEQLLENICIIVHPLLQHSALLLCTSAIKLPYISTVLLQHELIIEMSCQTIDMRCHSFSDPIKRTGWKASQFFTLTGKIYILFQAHPSSDFLTHSPAEWPNQKSMMLADLGILLQSCWWLVKPTGTAWLHPPLVTDPYRRQQPHVNAGCAMGEKDESSKSCRWPYRGRKHHSSRENPKQTTWFSFKAEENTTKMLRVVFTQDRFIKWASIWYFLPQTAQDRVCLLFITHCPNHVLDTDYYISSVILCNSIELY